MDKGLEAEAAALLALNEKRTPGEWFAILCHSRKYNGAVAAGTIERHTSVAMTSAGDDTDDGMNQRDADSEFIAAAPRMAALIRNLLAALREAEKDAGRYRWLRGCNMDSEIAVRTLGDTGTVWLVTGERLDKRIDAALTEGKP